MASVGDISGDGRPDAMVGARLADNSFQESGSAYVVFGQARSGPIDLLSLGVDRGYRLDGDAFNDNAGVSVAGAGDVNGDGLPDALVGAFVADNNNRDASGSAYVLFGPLCTIATTSTEAVALLGTSVRDVVCSGPGNDIIDGAAGNDLIDGAAGDDAIRGGVDIDTVYYYYASGPITADLVERIVTGGAGNDNLLSIENVVGTLFDDNLFGSLGINSIWGGDGRDYMDGRDGSDRLHGGIGDDILVGGPGNDVLIGGPGEDVCIQTSGIDVTVSCETIM